MATTQKQIKAKVLSASIDGDGQAVVTVEFVDGKNVWSKNYSYYTTQTIKESDLKERIRADIAKDLKAFDQLKEVKTIIGKQFTITL